MCDYQTLSSMAHAYRCTVSGCAPFVESSAKAQLVHIIDLLRRRVGHEEERRKLMATARDLYSRVHEVQRGADIAEHHAFVYQGLAEKAAQNLKDAGQVPLCIYGDAFRMIRETPAVDELVAKGPELEAHLVVCEETLKLFHQVMAYYKKVTNA